MKKSKTKHMGNKYEHLAKEVREKRERLLGSLKRIEQQEKLERINKRKGNKT